MTENKSRSIQGWLILGIPAVVIAIVYFIFPATQGERDNLLSSLGTTNHGEFVEPIVTLADVSFNVQVGKSWQVGRENPKWKLMVVDDGSCSDSCQQALFISRQVHKLLPKRADRIERIFVTPDQAELKVTNLLSTEYPGVSAITDNNGELTQLIATTNIPLQNGLIYLVDPRGYLVLYYTNDHDYKKMIKDLKVLL